MTDRAQKLGDVVEKMIEAHAKVMRNILWDECPDRDTVKQHEVEAMTAALAVLSDPANISDEMVEAATKSHADALGASSLTTNLRGLTPRKGKR